MHSCRAKQWQLTPGTRPCRTDCKLYLVTNVPMQMAPAAARGSPGLLPNNSFFVPTPRVATAARLDRHTRALTLRVLPRSRRRDDERDADPDPSTGTGRMVDEDMATLHRRIREARAALSEDDDIDGDADAPLAARWTELERGYDGSCVDGVRGAVCLLEAVLVNAHPGLGAGALALLLLLGVPASVFLLCAQLIRAVDGVSSAVNGK